MRASDTAGLVVLAIAVTGCGPVFGTETPAWLASTPSSHLYEGAAPPPAPVWPPQQQEQQDARPVVPVPRPSVVELRAPIVLVMHAPAGAGPDTVLNVTCAAPPQPAPVSRFRPSPYGDEDDEPIPTLAPYKPSPYEDPRPRLYRNE